MSKKNRRHEGGSRDGSRGGSRDGSRDGSREPGHQQLDAAFAAVWAAVDSGDVVSAEIECSALLTLPDKAGIERAAAGEYLEALVRNVLVRQRTPTGAAALRIMASLGPAEVKRAASRALGELIAEGIFAPEWAALVGKPVPLEAARSYDVYGDGELIVVTFGYGDTRHALVATVNRALEPVVTTIAVVPDDAKAIEMVSHVTDSLSREEVISLAEARRRLEGPLVLAAGNPLDELGQESVVCLPIARSRVRRLPASDAVRATFTPADRAAAVEEFMASSPTAGTDTEVLRFWAQVLTGFSGRVPDEPPFQVGPGKLAGVLLAHVPETFTLTEAELGGLADSVTAWTRWAAARQGLDGEAVTHLLGQLPSLFTDFDKVYNDPRAVAARAYVSDVVMSDIEMATLAGIAARRAFAMPHPGARAKEMALIDATKPSGRAMLVLNDFGSCKTDAEGRREFVHAVARVTEELWTGEPSSTWASALKLSAGGKSRHQILHELAERR